MRHAATLGEALDDFVAFQIGNSTGGTTYLHRSGDDFAFGYGIYDPDTKPSREMYDLVVAIGCNFIRDLTAGKAEPLEILMIGREPADLTPYRALTTRPIRFDQRETCLILPWRVVEVSARDGRSGDARDNPLRIIAAAAPSALGNVGPRQACSAFIDADGRPFDGRRRSPPCDPPEDAAPRARMRRNDVRGAQGRDPPRRCAPALIADAAPRCGCRPVLGLQHAQLLHPRVSSMERNVSEPMAAREDRRRISAVT